MFTINNLYGSFSIEFPTGTNTGLLVIHPEMAAAVIGIKPTERYFIYCVHPERGSCSFIVRQDSKDRWVSDRYPPFIDAQLITWIGERIEEHQ